MAYYGSHVPSFTMLQAETRKGLAVYYGTFDILSFTLSTLDMAELNSLLVKPTD